jgi:peptidoglycan/xylan/chitin deacetylase (PgdA/CDA1 family)
MLNFRNTKIFFSVLLISVIGLNFRYNIPVYIYPALLFLYSLILFYGCVFVDSGFFLPVICSAPAGKAGNKEGKKEIALSFDDGPAVSYTPEILKILQEEQAEAAFFCIGSRIAGNEDLFREIHGKGHIIGNHSHSHHFWFDLFSSRKMLTDLKMMDDATEKATGLRPKLFRPPYGVTNPNLRKAIIRGGYTPIGWNIRSLDTVIKDEAKLLKKINSALKPGAIILFHDTSETTLAVLPLFLRQVKASGYEIVRLDKMLTLPAYA